MPMLKHLTSIIYSLLFLLIMSVAILVGLSAFNSPINLRFFTVISGSMEPTIPLGSLVVVKPQESYQENDIVTIKSEANPRDTFTHRIVKVEEDKDINKLQYQTKGDANEDPDPEPSTHNRVLGKVIFHLPLVGRLIAFAQTQTGFIVIVVIPATVIVMSELNSMKNEVVRMWKERKTPAQPMNSQEKAKAFEKKFMTHEEPAIEPVKKIKTISLKKKNQKKKSEKTQIKKKK